MKSLKICLLVAAFSCMVPARAQQSQDNVYYKAMCSYYGQPVTGAVSAASADPYVESLVARIMNVIGLRPNFELRAANIPNAAAVILNNKRFILYNPKFMNQINAATGSEWAAISILAHEIGHHLSGHTLDNVGSRPETELEADEFSGFVLRRLGASLEDAQAVMKLIASIKGSHSHPPKSDRLAYIAAGWKKAGEQDKAIATDTDTAPARQPEAKEPKAVAETESKQPRQAPKSYIASDAYFITNPNAKYYLTSKGNLVLEKDHNYYIIASLARSDRNGFELMLAGDNNNIYISPRGVLVSDTGRKIGYLKAR